MFHFHVSICTCSTIYITTNTDVILGWGAMSATLPGQVSAEKMRALKAQTVPTEAFKSLKRKENKHLKISSKTERKQHHVRLDHIVYDCAPEVSPLKLSCYTDEDAMGKLKKLAMISYPNQMGRQVLSRYAAYTCVRWLRRLTE